ncbi:hypothetical protein BH11PSE8_BH11PSE8_17730 [soil metagenome]
MKIIFIAELFWPSVGGLQSRYLAWATELLRQGCTVEVWCISDEPDSPPDESLGGIRIRRLVSQPNYTKSGWGPRHLPTIVKFCLRIRKLGAELSTADGVIFAKWPFLPAAVLPLPKGPKLFFDWCEVRSSRFWSALYGGVIRRAQFTHVAIHSGIARWLRARGVSDRRILVIGSAAAASEGTATSVQRIDGRILFVGRLNPHKQPLLLLEAFALSGLAKHGGSLIFAGFGPQEDQLRAAANGMHGVQVLGEVSEEKKFELLASATLLALPSLREGFPIVVAEACGVGTPSLTVLAPDNGTVHLLDELQCGWSSEPTAAALSRKLAAHAWMADPAWQQASGFALKRAHDTLSIDAQISRLLAEIRRR